MSRDGYLPDNVRESDLPGANEPDHAEDCPANPDHEPICAECGLPELPHQIVPISQLPHDFVEDKDPECTCPTAEDIECEEAEAAEARAEARQEFGA